MRIGETMPSIPNISANDVIGIKMLNKTIETNEEMGAGIVNMMEKSTMEQSVNPNIGKNFDMYV